MFIYYVLHKVSGSHPCHLTYLFNSNSDH